MFMRLVTASSIAALVGIAAPAQAADLDQIIYARELPVTQSVEVGSGWYLRGDLGYSTKTRGAATNYSVFSAGPPATFTSTPYNSASLKRHWSGSLGVGYNFTDYLRGDLSFDYSRGRFHGTTSSAAACAGSAVGQCSSADTQTFEQYGFMANAYVDLGTFVGFTPYLGAGAGLTRVTWKPYTNDQTCVGACGAVVATDRISSGTQSWRFTYALMGGVSYDITKDLKLDVGYKYSKIKSGSQANFDAASITAGASGSQVSDNGFAKHEVRVGLRYSLW